MNADNSYLHRLVLAYPKAVQAEQQRAKPLYVVSDKKSTMNHFEDVTGNPVGRAIMLAVLLDQMDSGEFQTTPENRQRVAESFEKVFKEIGEDTE